MTEDLYQVRWPNLTAHREAWERAKRERPGDSVSELAKYAQSILDRAKLEEQANDPVNSETR